MRNKALGVWLLICMILCMFIVPVSAEKEGYYSYEIENGEATIIAVDSPTGEDIIVPATLGGYPVKSIGKHAFSRCYNVKSVEISNSVTSIGEGAFYNCMDLTSIEIPDSVVSIEHSAFEMCWSLTNIKLGNGVTSIGDRAFYRTAYYENSSNWEDGCLYIGKHLIEAGSNSIKDGTVCIADRAFWDCGLTSIEIPDSVISIGNYAFGCCRNLTSVTFGNGVTSIGDSAFYGCENLTGIESPNSVISVGKYAFQRCWSLTNIKLGNGVASIGEGAFWDCWSLESIEVSEESYNYSSENGVLFNKDKTTIICYPSGKEGAYAIPDSVISIDNGAFSGCRSLESIEVSEENNSYCSEDGVLFNKDKTTIIRYPAGNDGAYSIPDGIVNIADHAFEGCNLTSIEIPDSVVKIGNYAFEGCNLTSIEIPDSVVKIGNYAFEGCNLTSVTLGNGVTSIGKGTFCDCMDLTSIEIPDSVVSIGEYAFEMCWSLTNVKLGNGVNNIGEGAFYNCMDLTSIEISDSVVSIGEYAFSGCDELTSVIIGNGVTNIGNYAFGRCRGLTSIEIPGSVVSIGEGAFYDCSELTSVTLGNGVTSIDYYAFDSCENLTDVYYIGSKTDWNKKISISYGFNGARIHYSGDPNTQTSVTENNGHKVFNIVPNNINSNTVILALYKDGFITELKKEICTGEDIVFETDADYDTAKVMVWNGLENLEPVTDSEIIFQ